MDIFIYGTGGHAKVVYDTVLTMTGYNVICFVDDRSEQHSFLDLPVLKTPEAIKKTKTGVIAIGANHNRQKVAEEIKSINANINFVSVIHSHAIVSPLAKVEPGTVIMAGAIVNAGAVIESHCVLNSGSIVEHDCLLKKGSFLAPGAIVGGDVEVGERAFIALGAQVKHGVTIGSDAVVGMGSVVTKNIPMQTVAYGNPCAVVGKRDTDSKYL